MDKVKFLSRILVIVVLVVSSLTFFVYIRILYPLKYVDEIRTAGFVYQIKPELIASIINEESSFDNLSISRSGAIGLMQLMPQTAKWLSIRMGIDNFDVKKLYEPQFNINMGTFYLRYLMDRFLDDYTVLCAYNAGEGVVKGWLKNENYTVNKVHLITAPYNETNLYAKKVLKNLDKYKTRMESRF